MVTCQGWHITDRHSPTHSYSHPRVKLFVKDMYQHLTFTDTLVTSRNFRQRWHR